MSATTLEAAWDHLVAECAAADVVIETAALIESRALGLALTGGGLAERWEIVAMLTPVNVDQEISDHATEILGQATDDTAAEAS